MRFAASTILCILMALPVAAQERVPANLIHYDLQGSRFRLSDWVAIEGEFPPMPGQQGPVILIFGAHWCVPCHEVVHLVHSNREHLESAGVRVIFVHVDDLDRSQERSREEIQELVREMASAPEFEGVRVLQGGDLLEVRQWLGTAAGEGGEGGQTQLNLDALPGVVFIADDGIVLGRMAGSTGFEEALQSFLSTSAPETESQ